MTLGRVLSPLPAETEQLVRDAIGCFIAVHRELGPGMNEGVYSRASCIEFAEHGIAFEVEKPVPIRYRGHLIGQQRIDLFVEKQLIVEIKSVEKIHPVHVAQAVSYLRVTGARVALVVNFNVEVLKQGIRRVIL